MSDESSFRSTELLARLCAVLLTYVTCWPVWLFAGISVVMALAGVVQMATGGTGIASVGMMFPMAMFSSIVLASQLKTHFANPRSRLMPGFATPHLAVPAVICGTGIMILSLLLTGGKWIAGASTASAAALLTVWMTWAIYRSSTSLSLMTYILLGGGLYWGYRDQFRTMTAYCSGEFPVAAMVLAMGALFTGIVLIRRLLALNEEHEEYALVIPITSPWDIRSHTATRNLGKLAGLQMESLRLHAAVLDRSFAWMMRHQPRGGPYRLTWLSLAPFAFFLLVGAFVGALMVGAAIVLRIRQGSAATPPAPLLILMPAIQAVFCLALAVPIAAFRRWPYLRMHLLPGDRRELTHAMLQSLLAESVGATLAAMTGMTIGLLIVPTQPSLPGEVIAAVIATTFAWAMIAALINLWMLPGGRFLAAMMVDMALAWVIFMSLIAVVLTGAAERIETWAAIIAIPSVAIPALYILARRRWMNAEFGR